MIAFAIEITDRTVCRPSTPSSGQMAHCYNTVLATTLAPQLGRP